jgi:hypothetical protein
MRGERAGRLAWLGHLLDVQKVAGSNPARPTRTFVFEISIIDSAKLFVVKTFIAFRFDTLITFRLF